jgi:hypothetical protein
MLVYCSQFITTLNCVGATFPQTVRRMKQSSLSSFIKKPKPKESTDQKKQQDPVKLNKEDGENEIQFDDDVIDKKSQSPKKTTTPTLVTSPKKEASSPSKSIIKKEVIKEKITTNATVTIGETKSKLVETEKKQIKRKREEENEDDEEEDTKDDDDDNPNTKRRKGDIDSEDEDEEQEDEVEEYEDLPEVSTGVLQKIEKKKSSTAAS